MDGIRTRVWLWSEQGSRGVWSRPHYFVAVFALVSLLACQSPLSSGSDFSWRALNNLCAERPLTSDEWREFITRCESDAAQWTDKYSQLSCAQVILYRAQAAPSYAELEWGRRWAFNTLRRTDIREEDLVSTCRHLARVTRTEPSERVDETLASLAMMEELRGRVESAQAHAEIDVCVLAACAYARLGLDMQPVALTGHFERASHRLSESKVSSLDDHTSIAEIARGYRGLFIHGQPRVGERIDKDRGLQSVVDDAKDKKDSLIVFVNDACHGCSLVIERGADIAATCGVSLVAVDVSRPGGRYLPRDASWRWIDDASGSQLLSARWGIESVPTILLMDHTGALQWKGIGADDLFPMLRERYKRK